MSAIDTLLNMAAKQMPPDEEKPERRSRVINRAYVRKWALDYARANRSHRFERVSEKFLNDIEVTTRCAIVDKITRHPSKGKTLT